MAKEKRFDRYCTVCGKYYEYCPTCSRFAHMERWHDAYCSENCKDLYNVTAGFMNHWQEPEVEAARLQKLDLSYKNKLPAWMQLAINDIKRVDIAEDKKVSEEKSTTEDVEVKPDSVGVASQDDDVKDEEKPVVETHKSDKKNNQNKYKSNKFSK